MELGLQCLASRPVRGHVTRGLHGFTAVGGLARGLYWAAVQALCCAVPRCAVPCGASHTPPSLQSTPLPGNVAARHVAHGVRHAGVGGSGAPRGRQDLLARGLGLAADQGGVRDQTRANPLRAGWVAQGGNMPSPMPPPPRTRTAGTPAVTRTYTHAGCAQNRIPRRAWPRCW